MLPFLKGNERETWCALVLARLGILRAVEIKKWSHGAVRGSQGEDRCRRGLSYGDTLRLGLIIGEGGKSRGIVGFDAGNAGIDARLGDELKRELADERHQDIACRRRHGGLRRRVWFRLPVERVRTKPAVDRIQGIV